MVGSILFTAQIKNRRKGNAWRAENARGVPKYPRKTRLHDSLKSRVNEWTADKAFAHAYE